MTDRKQTGNWGEALALTYLQGEGYAIECCNFRHRRTEIDLVASHDNKLVFVEVKTRTTLAFGGPSCHFPHAQRRRISRAASAYMDLTHYDWEIRFDLIAIHRRSETDYTLQHFEDVFFPGLF